MKELKKSSALKKISAAGTFNEGFATTEYVAAAHLDMAYHTEEKEIADIAGVADVTIRQSYKLMLPRAPELFPEGFKFTTSIENLPQSQYWLCTKEK